MGFHCLIKSGLGKKVFMFKVEKNLICHGQKKILPMADQELNLNVKLEC